MIRIEEILATGFQRDRIYAAFRAEIFMLVFLGKTCYAGEYLLYL